MKRKHRAPKKVWRGKYQNKRQKLTEEQKVEIVNMWRTGVYTKSQLGDQFNVSSSWIGSIISFARTGK